MRNIVTQPMQEIVDSTFPAKDLSTDELKILAERNKIKHYGSLSTQKLIENLSKVTDIQTQLPVQITKPLLELNQIEKRVLAQRVGIKKYS